MKGSVIISGWGLVSPLGKGAWETFSALREGHTICDRTDGLPSDIDPVDLVSTVGSVSVARHIAGDPAVELAERAAREAMFMAAVNPKEVHCLTGNSKGAVHATIGAIQGRLPASASTDSGNRPRPRVVDADLAIALGPHGYLCYQLQQRLGIKRPLNVVAACASSLTAVHQASMMLKNLESCDKPQRILVITAEASLLPVFIHSYRRLGVLGPLLPAQYRGRPLDQNRCGFMLAELAAAMVLEWVDHVQPGQIELIDTAIASESYDLIRTSTEMPALSRVAKKLLADHPIDVLHPHATGTVQHDEAELITLCAHLITQPDIYACKGALGHGLGASGLVSLVIACLCAKAGGRPPMPWLDHPIDSGLSGMVIAKSAVERSVPTHAVFAAGFGGHVAGAVITKR